MFQNLVSQVREQAAKIFPIKEQAARFIPEWQALSEKIQQLGGKTAGEIERLTSKMVDSLLGTEEVSPELRSEIVTMLVEVNQDKKLVVHFPYFQSLASGVLPKSVKDLTEVKSKLVAQLKEDAGARLAAKKKDGKKKLTSKQPT